MSRQDRFSASSSSGSKEPDSDDILLQIQIRLRLDEVADVEAKLLPANTRRQPSSRELRQLASQIYDSRREQHRLLSSKNYGEPAWDMMLALYCFPRRGIFLGVTSLAHVANISQAAGSRWQQILLEEGLIERGPCVNDGRRQLVRLTTKGRQLIEEYLVKLFYRAPDVSVLDESSS